MKVPKILTRAQVAVNVDTFAARDAARARLAECDAAIAKQTEAVSRLDREAVLAYGLPNFPEVRAALTTANAELDQLGFARRAAQQKLAEAEQACHLLSIANKKRPVQCKLEELKSWSRDHEKLAVAYDASVRAGYSLVDEVRSLWPGVPQAGSLLSKTSKLTIALDAFTRLLADRPSRGFPRPAGHMAPNMQLHGFSKRTMTLTELIAEAADGLMTVLERAPITVREPAPVAPEPVVKAPVQTDIEDFTKPMSDIDRRIVEGKVEIIGGAHLLVKKS